MNFIIVDTEFVTAATDKDYSTELAESIAATGLMLRPPVIVKTAVDQYEVISGTELYWAYIAAMNINSALPDRIHAILVQPHQVEAALVQLAA